MKNKTLNQASGIFLVAMTSGQALGEVDPRGPVEYPGDESHDGRQGVQARGYQFQNDGTQVSPWSAHWIWLDGDARAAARMFRKEITRPVILLNGKTAKPKMHVSAGTYHFEVTGLISAVKRVFPMIKKGKYLLEFTCIAIMLGLTQLHSSAAQMQIAPGRFTDTAESLTNYECPKWFHDAKFGIWAHWGPQAVPRAGDWYARNMYLQGSPQYESHLKNYGHPSTNGYKDIIQLWKAEKWDPDALMALYVKAGAKYFVSMGVHHDNFDLWNSKFHSWNAVQMGPHRDIVGDWRKAAQKYGMRFGVSEHLGPSFGWFAPSHGYDQFSEPGAKLGIPYDGADPKYQELYHPVNNEPFRWGRSWYATNSAWHQEWFNRIKDLVDHYQPDLLYTDGGIPFGEVGRSLVAHFYNVNAAAHGGHLEAVYNFKDLGTGEFIPHAGVEDVERGVMKDINPLPWQTCTSMGDWFYSDGFQYKTTAQVVHMLADIVSKNGNLLLNVVLYADGSLPPESRQFLDEMATWMSVNGEAIYGTRPWKIFGEGPTIVAAGSFKEDTHYTPQDIRFTTKDRHLYAICLGWPSEGKVVINSLAKTDNTSMNQIRRIKLLGSDEKLKFTQTTAGLTVELPTQKVSDIACTLKIFGSNLQPAKSLTSAYGIPRPSGLKVGLNQNL